MKKAADIKESTLYPILKKLQIAGYLTTYSQEYQGRKRKYYSLTEEGKAQIAYLSNEWQIYKDTVDGIIEGRMKMQWNILPSIFRRQMRKEQKN